MSILISALLLQAAAVTAPGGGQPVQVAASGVTAAPAAERKTCRDMLLSSSRLGTMRICKTRAAWRQWEKCHSATRYCAKPRKAARSAALASNDTIICKYLKTTGTRLGTDRMCATKRQWEVTEQEIQDAIRDRQNRSTLTGGSESPPKPGGGGPF